MDPGGNPVMDTQSRVLIADGDAVLRRQLYKRLLDHDVFSDCVPDGVSALRALDERPYTMVILDIGLEKADGYQVLDRIRSIANAERPVVLITVTTQDPRMLDTELVQVVLRKPLRINEITDLVRSCLRTMGDDTILRRQRSKREERNAVIAASTAEDLTST
jgi:DNA-binding response OmpR family regulator